MYTGNKGRGFTLMELMIVVAIVAILASIAYPSYQNHLIKANRASAQAYLMDLAQRQKLFFNHSRAFAADEAALSADQPERVTKNYSVSFALDPNAPPTFTLSAAPKSGSIQVSDGTLTIDSAGAKLRGGEPW